MEGQILYATRIFDDPVIIYCKRWSLFDVESGLQVVPIHPVVKKMEDEEVIWLIPTPWLAEDRWAAKIYRYTLEAIKTTSPKHRVIFVANTRAEHAHFKRLGMESLVANQNQFVDRSLFLPLGQTENCRFDAVYNARFQPYKRHNLARNIERLALIGYTFDTPEFSSIANMLPSAHFSNEKGGEWRILSEVEVNEVLNKASCGLCLSEVEGAMTAAVEYLLAGIPVVTTPSRGGRDHFFDGRFTRWVCPNAVDVAREVHSLVDERISPEFIRTETIKKIDNANEEFFYDLSSMLLISQVQLSESYSKRFNHRLASPKPLNAILEKHDAASINKSR